MPACVCPCSCACARINKMKMKRTKRTSTWPKTTILSVPERDKRCMWWHCFYEQLSAMINVTQSFQHSVISSYYRRLFHEIGARWFSFFLRITLTLHLLLHALAFFIFASFCASICFTRRSRCRCRFARVCLAQFSSMLSNVILHLIQMEIDSVCEIILASFK